MCGCVFPSLSILQMCGDSSFGDFDVHRQLSDSFHLDAAANVIHHMPWFFHHLQKNAHYCEINTYRNCSSMCFIVATIMAEMIMSLFALRHLQYTVQLGSVSHYTQVFKL